MSSGGITMIGPEVAFITAKHDFNNLYVLQFKPIVIKKEHGWVSEQLSFWELLLVNGQ